MPHASSEMKRCREKCHSCHDICVETALHCLEQEPRRTDAAHIRLLLDCAQICRTSGDFLLRGSSLHERTCAVCAEICIRCAEACDQIVDDPVLRQCAETCRRCADSCAEMAGARAAA